MKNEKVKSAYIHIPFCDSICSYCDFCKMYYNKDLTDRYLDSLYKEIKENYKNEKLQTIYIGGGTPSSLSLNELEKLLKMLLILNKDEKYEYTIELNIENTTIDKLKLLKRYGVNRLSFGVQTINSKLLKTLNRSHTKRQVEDTIRLANKLGFLNISVDLMYALPEEKIKDVEEDLNFILKLPITHISTYSLILEEHTKFYLDKIKPIDEEVDLEMYNKIRKYLRENGFTHYEISNFAKNGFFSKHNLTYWNNEQYYGFGLGASGYIDNVRYTNTRSINKYCSGKFLYDTEILNTQDIMTYEMILGLRKRKGVSKKEFKEKFGIGIDEAFDYTDTIKKDLIEEDEFLRIKEDKLYVSNEVLMTFVGGKEYE